MCWIPWIGRVSLQDTTSENSHSLEWVKPSRSVVELTMGPVLMLIHSYHFATQPVILWIELGAKPKWLPLNFRNHDVMRTAPIMCTWQSSCRKGELTWYRGDWVFQWFNHRARVKKSTRFTKSTRKRHHWRGKKLDGEGLFTGIYTAALSSKLNLRWRSNGGAKHILNFALVWC